MVSVSEARPHGVERSPALQVGPAWPLKWQLTTAVILAVAAVLRFANLGQLPLPLSDEVFAAVDLHSLLATGRHLDGSPAGVLAYIVAAVDGRFVSLLWGNDLFSLRAISATFGVLTVALLVVLGQELGDRSLGVIAAAVLAVMPWSIYFSRIFYPASEVAFLTCLALWLAMVALRKHSLLAGVASAIASVTAVYIYPVSIVSTPLLLLAVVSVRLRDTVAFGIYKALLILVVTVLLLAPYVISHVAITDATVANQNIVMAQQMIWSHGLSPSAIVDRFIQQWLAYLSAPFTILHGDPNVRWSIQMMGSVGWIAGTLGWIGIAIALGRHARTDMLLLVWLVFYPIADALTFFAATPNSVRGIMGSVVWSFFVATTIRQLFRMSNKRLRASASANRRLRVGALGAIVLGMSVQTLVFSAVYFGEYSTRYAYAFETGYAKIYPILRKNDLQSIPITLHAGYGRDAMLQFFSDYRLHSDEHVLACYDLPYNDLHFTELPRVFIVREDPDVQEAPGCIHDGLIQRDEAALLSVPAGPGQRARKLDVVAVFPDDGSGKYFTAVFYLHY